MNYKQRNDTIENYLLPTLSEVVQRDVNEWTSKCPKCGAKLYISRFGRVKYCVVACTKGCTKNWNSFLKTIQDPQANKVLTSIIEPKFTDDRFLSLDMETAGLDLNLNPPCSLAVLVWENNQVIDQFYCLFSPPSSKWKYSQEALDINGFSLEKLKSDGKSFSKCYDDLKSWAKEYKHLPIIAHNASFDASFYSNFLHIASSQKSGRNYKRVKNPLLGTWLCTRELAVEYLDLPNYKLDTVARHFNLARKSSSHDALEDAKLAGEVYLKLLGK